MIFSIEPASQRPVYQQLMDQVKYAVASGRLRGGDRLPPIREVAVQTRVNRNTVARAYAELEREGLIFSRPGQGSFIADSGPGVGLSRARKQLTDPIDQLLVEAHRLGLDRDTLLRLIGERLDKLEL